MPLTPHLSIVLPCFNEGPRIASSLTTLQSWVGEDAEILVVDDGSEDGTSQQAEGYGKEHPRVRAHSLLRHRGKGRAIRAAIPLVGGDRVVFVDADLAFDRESVQRAIDGLATAEIVVGNRRHEGSRYSVPVSVFGFLYRRHLAGLLFNAFVRSALGVRARDTQCGLKAFRRESLERIAPSLSLEGFALDVEILLVAKALGIQPVEIPVNVRYESPKSSVKLLRSAWAMTSDIVTLAARRVTGRYAPARVRALAAGAAGNAAARRG